MDEKKLYMAVTLDKYELPLCVCGTIQDLARKMGLSAKAVKHYDKIKNCGLQAGIKIICVDLDSEDE